MGEESKSSSNVDTITEAKRGRDDEKTLSNWNQGGEGNSSRRKEKCLEHGVCGVKDNSSIHIIIIVIIKLIHTSIETVWLKSNFGGCISGIFLQNMKGKKKVNDV